MWEGRHKGTVVDTNEYFVACCRYIELNPARAGIVEHPSEYKWSSFRANAEGFRESLVSIHPILKSLGTSAYKSLVNEPMDCEQLDVIRKATQDGVPLGNDRFKDEIGKTLKRRIGYKQRGRPPVKK